MYAWKYALVQVAQEDGNPICELFELYNIDGEWNAFCSARLNSLSELQNACVDAERDGINTWFWERGAFSWNKEEGEWEWETKDG